MNFKITEYQKLKRINTRLHLKITFIWTKKKHTVISEMSGRNLLRRSASGFYENDNFPGTFVDVCLKIFTQEGISTYDDPCM